MTFISLSAYANWPVIKQVAIVFGWVMQGIFVVLSKVGILNVGICILVFTLITRMLLLPLTIKQQKFSKVQSLMNPELQALQKKYENRKDQASMAKMQTEQQMLYDKYGVSMSAGCLPSLLQLIILFGLYPVIYNLENYVPQLANYTEAELTQMYTFLGINLSEAPGFKLSIALIIPILAGVFQFVSYQMTMKNTQTYTNSGNATADSMNQSMKMMGYMMPILSIYICITLPAFLGLYWVFQSILMVIQQYFINQYMKKVSVEDLIRKNVEKKNKKRAKKGLPPINDKATVNTKKYNGGVYTTSTKKQNSGNKSQSQTEQTQASAESSNKKSKSGSRSTGTSSGSGSIAARANMVREYNEKHKK